jgi:hypothetical protein
MIICSRVSYTDYYLTPSPTDSFKQDFLRVQRSALKLSAIHIVIVDPDLERKGRPVHI